MAVTRPLNRIIIKKCSQNPISFMRHNTIYIRRPKHNVRQMIVGYNLYIYEREREEDESVRL